MRKRSHKLLSVVRSRPKILPSPILSARTVPSTITYKFRVKSVKDPRNLGAEVAGPAATHSSAMSQHAPVRTFAVSFQRHRDIHPANPSHSVVPEACAGLVAAFC